MNRSFRAEESSTGLRQRQPLMGSIRSSDEELSLFLEMRRREKDRNNTNLFLQEFDPLGSKNGSSLVYNMASAAPVRRTRAEEFLNADNDKSDYDWLLTPPGTPLFPSLEMGLQRTAMSQLEPSKVHPTALRSRLTNPLPEANARSSLASRQLSSSPGSSTSSSTLRRPSSSSGSRPSTPTSRPTLSSSRSTLTSASRPTSTAAAKAVTSTATSKTMSTTMASRSSRSTTPNSRATMHSGKPAAPPRSSTPTARSSARSSTPTTRASITGSRSTSRAATPTRTTNATVPQGKPLSSSSGTKSATTASRNPTAPRASSPTVKPRPWKPSDMPGFSLDAPPNLRTSLPDRPISATRGRPGAPSARSSSVEPASNGRARRQSCSPARGRPPNGVMHSSGSSVPVQSMGRLRAKANDNVSPVMVGTKMVERVVNMRKLVPPKQDGKHSPHSNLSMKSSSPDSGFGRSLSKKSLDMAIRHMDIRQRIPGNLRPSMTNIPASSMYSVRSGPQRSRSISVPDSPLATSSNASSEVSFSNNAVCVDRIEIDDDISSDKGARSPASVHGR